MCICITTDFKSNTQYRFHRFHRLFQSGFRLTHSANTAHLDTDNIFQNANDGKVTALYYLDLKKAFVTIKHESLMKKKI